MMFRAGCIAPVRLAEVRYNVADSNQLKICEEFENKVLRIMEFVSPGINYADLKNDIAKRDAANCNRLRALVKYANDWTGTDGVLRYEISTHIFGAEGATFDFLTDKMRKLVVQTRGTTNKEAEGLGALISGHTGTLHDNTFISFTLHFPAKKKEDVRMYECGMTFWPLTIPTKIFSKLVHHSPSIF